MRGVLLLGLICGALYLAFWPIIVDPQPYAAPKAPALEGDFAPSYELAEADKLALPPGADGPEDLAVLDGQIYTADVNGGLFRLDGDRFVEVAKLGGRPLGLDEGPDGALYISDSYQGLMRWSPAAGLETLVTEVAGAPLIYANQLDVASDGSVYFSNSTDRFDPELLGGTKPTSVMTIWEQSQTGYVARWRPDGQVEKLSEGFVYTNGVALSPGEDFLLVAETGRARVHKLWLTGPQAGTRQILMENLPGYPDNIEPVGDGTYWLAFASPRVPTEFLLPHPFWRKVIWRLGPWVRPAPIVHGMVMRFDGDGTVLQVLQDADGVLGITSGARMVGDALYIGILEGDAMGRLKLGDLR